MRIKSELSNTIHQGYYKTIYYVLQIYVFFNIKKFPSFTEQTHNVLIVGNSFLIKYNFLKYVCISILIFFSLINTIFSPKQQFFYQLIQWFKGIGTQSSYSPYQFNSTEKP